jgi:hypothetical protein
MKTGFSEKVEIEAVFEIEVSPLDARGETPLFLE